MNHKLCKVLIVDDELLIRQGIKHTIQWESEGFEVVGEAANGKEALALIKEKEPHIVITDMVMPIMDGEQLTRLIKKEYSNIEVIILSSFSDYDYVRATFQQGVSDYILKPELGEESLLQALYQAVARIPDVHLKPQDPEDMTTQINQVIEKAMMGYDVDEFLPKVKEVFPNENYCLLAIDYKNRYAKKTHNQQALLDKLEKEMDHTFTSIVVHKISADEHTAVFLLNFKSNQLQVIKQFIQETTKSIGFENETIGWILTISFSNFVELKAVYEKELLPLLNYRFYFPNQQVIIQDELPENEAIKQTFQLTKFTDLFKHKKFDAAFDYLDNHIQKISIQYTTDEYSFKSFLGNIIFNITILLGNMAYESEELERKRMTYMTAVDEALHIDSALTLFAEFLGEVETIITSKTEDIHHPKMQELLDYIDQHYAKPLNLSDMAKQFHYNPSYLSNFFSENSNLGFSEYVNKVRIEKSIERLEKGTESIAEIGMLVGYSDPSYYGKVFRSFMGTSPSKYRRQYLRAGKKKR